MFSILVGCLSLLKYKLSESQNDILKFNSSYTFPIILSNAWHLYLILTVVVIYCLDLPKKPKSIYKYEKLKREK